MQQRAKITIGVLLLLLALSISGNVALYLMARTQTAEAQEEADELRQEIKELRDEIRLLRSQTHSQERLEELMVTIASQTELLRTLKPKGEVIQEMISREDMGQLLADKLAEEYPPQDVERDEFVLSTLEMIPPDLALDETMNRLLEEQVAGLYDPETETLYVVSQMGGMGSLEKVVFAHEYTHALQDQQFDLEAMGVTPDSDLNDDQQIALHALIEGDASFLMQQYMLTHFTPLEVVGLLGSAMTLDQTALNETPSALRQSLTFPYEDGLYFVTNLYGRGGWEMIDQAYVQPPQSSEQILHPSRYPDDRPVSVTLPQLSLGDNWELVDENVMGEFGLSLYLDVYLTQNQAAQAADGWGGDYYALYRHTEHNQPLLVFQLIWDDQSEADEFSELFREYAQKRLGEEESQFVEDGLTQMWIGEQDVLSLIPSAGSESAQTLIILAPDTATVEQVQNSFPNL